MSQSLFRGVVGLSLLLSLSCSAMQQTIMRDDAGFKVLDKGQWNQVKSHHVEPALLKMSPELLHEYFAAGCRIRACRCTNGDYVLRSFVPGKGGGPFFGAITAVVGTVATGVATVGVGLAVAVKVGPKAGAAAAVATAHAGMAATIYATGTVTAAPTP